MSRRLLSPQHVALIGLLLATARLASAAPAAPAAAAPSASASLPAVPATAPDTAAPVTPAPTTTPDSGAAATAAPGATPGPTSDKADSEADAKFSSAPAASDSFASEDTTDSDQAHKLDLYGFADFTYQRLLIPKSNVWTRTYPSVNSFAVGNFNLYLSSNLGDSWRALAEVRFLYLPNGATTADPATGNAVRTDTTVLDYAGFEEPIRWGGIQIERIYIEHEFNGLLHLQMGQFLTPYGIWNVDHGSPTIIGIKKPFVVANELFPEQQMGLQLYGSGFLDPFEIGYNLTLSNGRGPVDYEDFNDDKAYGGRLYAKTDAIGSLTVGASFYRGGYYDRSAKYTLTQTDGHSVVDQVFTTLSKYQEMSTAADVKWEYKSWLAQGEFIMNEAHFSQGGRPRGTVVQGPQGISRLTIDAVQGAYGLVGYRLLPVVPLYGRHTSSCSMPTRRTCPSTPPATAYEVGVNLRATAAVVVKLEYTDWHFSAPGSVGYGYFLLRTLASQVAWRAF